MFIGQFFKGNNMGAMKIRNGRNYAKVNEKSMCHT